MYVKTTETALVFVFAKFPVFVLPDLFVPCSLHCSVLRIQSAAFFSFSFIVFSLWRFRCADEALQMHLAIFVAILVTCLTKLLQLLQFFVLLLWLLFLSSLATRPRAQKNSSSSRIVASFWLGKEPSPFFYFRLEMNKKRITFRICSRKSQLLLVFFLYNEESLLDR